MGGIMFAVVMFKEKERSFLSFFKKQKIMAERVNLPNGESFFVITAEKKGDKIPFKEILSFAGGLGNSLIFPSDFCFLPEWDYTPFEPKQLKKKMLFDSAVKHLEKTKLNPMEVSVCICDDEGIYSDEIHKLLKLAAKIHIVCHNKELYEKEIKEILFEYGISITLSSSFDARATLCNVVISHESENIPLFFDGTVFTNEKRPFLAQRCFGTQSIRLPFEYEKLRPPGVDKLTFASALYEKCGVHFDS
ncbi:MAG: hypothetical protein IJ491_02615 [Clostridia bacterium]|nr:hypothetical protein [Clostridia bacterium]